MLLRLAWCPACIFLVGLCVTSSAVANRPPNIVLILTDDLGYGDTSVYGGTAVPTPEIERLAASGTTFTQAYATSSTCTPSRYAILTGEYPWRRPPQQTAILDGDAPLAIEPERPNLAHFLREHGYVTGLIGKWHLGLGDGKTAVDFNQHIAPGPLEIGFDEAFFIPATVDRVPCVFIENHRVHGLDPSDPIQVSYRQPLGDDPLGYEHPELLKVGADRQHAEAIVNGISRIGHMSGGEAARWIDEEIADTITARAVDFIERHKDEPFFLHFGTHDPHVPRMPHPRFRGLSETGIRGDTIAQIDWVVGEIRAALERAVVADNTLLIFSSDNGPVLFDGYYDGAEEDVGDHEPGGGLRGWKYLRYEASTRVPLIAVWPGHVAEGKRSAAIFSQLDLFATIGAMLKKSLPEGASIDGRAYLDVFLGKSPEGRREVVQHGIGNTLALRSGDWKYIPASADSATGIGSGADPNDKRFSRAIVNEPLLFNLAEDPSETTNLAERFPEKVVELASRLNALKEAP